MAVQALAVVLKPAILVMLLHLEARNRSSHFSSTCRNSFGTADICGMLTLQSLGVISFSSPVAAAYQTYCGR